MSLILVLTIGQAVSSTLVWIGFYGVPRAFLIHSYSLIGLLRRTSQQPRRAESLHYGMDAAPRTSVTPRAEAPSFAAKSA